MALVYRLITLLIAALGVFYYLGNRREMAEVIHEAEAGVSRLTNDQLKTPSATGVALPTTSTPANTAAGRKSCRTPAGRA